MNDNLIQETKKREFYVEMIFCIVNIFSISYSFFDKRENIAHSSHLGGIINGALLGIILLNHDKIKTKGKLPFTILYLVYILYLLYYYSFNHKNCSNKSDYEISESNIHRT